MKKLTAIVLSAAFFTLVSPSCKDSRPPHELQSIDDMAKSDSEMGEVFPSTLGFLSNNYAEFYRKNAATQKDWALYALARAITYSVSMRETEKLIDEGLPTAEACAASGDSKQVLSAAKFYEDCTKEYQLLPGRIISLCERAAAAYESLSKMKSVKKKDALKYSERANSLQQRADGLWTLTIK